MKSFEELNIRPEIVRALKEEGIIEPNTIQEKSLPLVYAGKDLIGISRTGSGKTVCFGVPLLEKVQPRKGVQGFVLAPTRELANQISGELKKWSKYLNLNIATVFGGVGLEPQARSLARSEIVVGTPGRVLDHLGRGNLDLSQLQCFVLDEADKMVEMGFIEDIEQILSATPPRRQILLFGATISGEVDCLKDRYMHDVAVAEAELQVEKDLLRQYYYNIQHFEKFSLLVHLLKKEDTERVIIFCSKRSTVELVNRNLHAQGIRSEMIHGKMSQNKRLRVMDQFNRCLKGYLVASAVAARGLDIKDVTHVFNYDLSRDPQEYIHRVGRTARAGESGKAITLLSPQDHEAFHAIFRHYDIDAEELPIGDFPRLKFQARASSSGSYRHSQDRRNFPQRSRQPSHQYHQRGYSPYQNRSPGDSSPTSGLSERPLRRSGFSPQP